MGLCKCPKKRVTQQFCFNHRVNVCEFCMINSHTTCIVQPYLQWLEDSSFKPKCSFCSLNLSNEECVRLLCYHVYHWTCLNKYCSQLPSNTAPAGFACPDCNIPIFPSSNTPSPIYIALKKKLSTTEWARIGLGLPSANSTANNKLVQSDVQPKNEQSTATKNQIENPVNAIQETFEQKQNLNNVFIHHDPPQVNNYDSQPITVNNVSNYLNNHTSSNNYSLKSHPNDFSQQSFNSSITRNKFLDNAGDYSTDRLILNIDDENKYRTRSSLDRLLRYLKFFSYKHSLTSNQRSKILITSAVLGAFFIFYLLVKWGRSSAADDPLLDPKFNPNIHVQDVDNFN